MTKLEIITYIETLGYTETDIDTYSNGTYSIYVDDIQTKLSYNQYTSTIVNNKLTNNDTIDNWLTISINDANNLG